VSLHRQFTQTCAKLVDEKNMTVLLSKCSWFRAKNIDRRCTSYKFWK